MDNNDTICRTCHHLREGQCDGEKEQAACLGYKRMTNADRIRAMTDEELAKWLCTEIGCCNCNYLFSDKCDNGNAWLDWLKQEVSDNG